MVRGKANDYEPSIPLQRRCASKQCDERTMTCFTKITSLSVALPPA